MNFSSSVSRVGPVIHIGQKDEPRSPSTRGSWVPSTRVQDGAQEVATSCNHFRNLRRKAMFRTSQVNIR